MNNVVEIATNICYNIFINSSKIQNLTVCKVMLRECKVDVVVFVGAFCYNGSITTKEVLL